MIKKIVSTLLAIIMVFTTVPATAFASDNENVYISISYDGQFVTDKNGDAIAYVAVPMNELAEIDLNEYGLSDYVYDADGDGNQDITAVHLYIYTHENVIGDEWSNVNVSGGPGSIFFESGLFGFSDCNLLYFHNGIYPEVSGWGVTADQLVLEAGDFLDVAGYTSWEFYTDSASGFHYFADENGEFTHNYSADAGKESTVKLVRSYSAMGSDPIVYDETGYTVYYGTSVGNAEGSVTTDDCGEAKIIFPSAGTWYVWCDGGYGAECDDAIVSSSTSAIVTVASSVPEHEWEEDYTVDKEATCTEEGSKSIHCKNCDEKKDVTVIEKLPHTEVIDEAVKATCTKDGLTEGSHCSVCNTVLKAQEKVSATGHSYGSYKTTVKASFGKSGKEVATCKGCEKTKSRTIEAVKTPTLSKTVYTFNNQVKKPTVTVKDTNGDKVSYSVSYASGRKNVGKYSVKVTLKGEDYSGSKTVYFKINPKEVALSGLTKSKKAFTAKWEKPSSTYRKQMTGYQIRYSTSENMKDAKKVTIKSTTANSKTISSLKSNKKYYVQLRTYKKIGSAYYYSNWSTAKSVKTK